MRDDLEVDRNSIEVDRNNIEVDRKNIDVSVAPTFFRRAIPGTPDASTYLHDRHAPGACRFSRNSSSSPVPGCPATSGRLQQGEE
jgi:hypothetical protein